jgi:signal transduction histidine kinase/tetratricopeptide (TPR) repeat protein
VKKLFASIFFLALCRLAISQPSAQSHFIDSLKQQLATEKNDSSKIATLRRIGSAYLWSNPDTAMVYARREYDLASKSERPDWIAFAIASMGWIFEARGDYPQAIRADLEAIRRAESLSDKTILLRSYWAITDAYKDAGDFAHALEYAQKALKISAPGVGNIQALVSNVQLGEVYERFDRLDSARVYIQKAYEGDSAISGRLTWGDIPLIRANIYIKEGNYQMAFREYHQALVLAMKENIGKDIMDIYDGLANAHAKSGQTDSAIFYAKKSIELSKSTPYPLAVLNASNLLSKIYKSKQNTDSLIKYMQFSTVLKDSIFNQHKLSEVENLSFNETLRQADILQSRKELKQRIILYASLAGLAFVLIIAVLLYRNNQHKQKTLAIVQKQKQEIDEQKTRVEQALSDLKSTQAQLMQQEKMASLGEMTAGIAHEIQNPLNFVNNFSEVNAELLNDMKKEIEQGDLQEAKKIADSVIDNEQKILHHGKRADNIVKGMLLHSRQNTGQREMVDINAMAEEYFRLSYHGFRGLDKHFNSAMDSQMDESIGKLKIVPQDFGRVLLNLFNNAFFSVAEKSRKSSNGYAPAVSLSSRKIGDHIELKIKDNGNGIPKELMDKIFQPFFTTKPAGQGTGLGLSISYDIIKSNGGELSVDSKPGEYAEFTIHLPT